MLRRRQYRICRANCANMGKGLVAMVYKSASWFIKTASWFIKPISWLINIDMIYKSASWFIKPAS